MSRLVRPLTTTRSSTTCVQSLSNRLDGITAGDYLTWVRDSEPPALDSGLRSVAISAEPLGQLINIELVWAGHPPKTPSAAAIAAGFPMTPEVSAIRSANDTAAGASHRSSCTSIVVLSQNPSDAERPSDARLAGAACQPN